MAVPLLPHLDRHAEKAGGLPQIGTPLHCPGRGRMAEHMRCDSIRPGQRQLCRSDDRRKALAHRAHRLAVPLDNGMRGNAKPMPSAEMR